MGCGSRTGRTRRRHVGAGLVVLPVAIHAVALIALVVAFLAALPGLPPPPP